MKYNPSEIEPRWQKYWDENEIFKVTEDRDKPKYYVLDMFPYPSAAGLHVGHPLGYFASDIIARYKRMRGYNVLHPMGWDAFGLPAEQYAIQTGTHPAVTTSENIKTFKRQIKSLGFSYDWSREINTTDIEYYKWTQWIFLQLYKKGLAYEAEVPVNWCPELGTVLANEEVISGKSERGGFPVFRLPMKQWMLKITDYADSLLEGLNNLDWPEHLKDLQRNWIGRSEGAEVNFSVDNSDKIITVFTTRPDTLFGATYMVLAPEHPLVEKLTIDSQKNDIRAYQKESSTKTDLERGDLNDDKTGVFTGSYAINPVNNKKIPIWIADYVLISYGTGAIMAVPGQDQRDWDFAQRFNLPIIRTVSPPSDFDGKAYTGDGPAINSEMLNGLNTNEAKEKIIDWLIKHKKGIRKINYKLRDWLFSRQRYWGEPFPIIHINGEHTAVDDSQLPVILPEVEKYEPSGQGKSPLSTIKEWVELRDVNNKLYGLRETNTMPQWAGSCWYYLRFTDPLNLESAWNKKKESYWMPVDLYIGGQEHAVLHLLYSRFWHHVLHDLNLVSTREPFQKLYNQGMILGEDGQKMSKSRGNVINPDKIIDEFGADAFRLYEMFLGPLDKAKPWNTKGLHGAYRFIERLWTLFNSRDDKLTSDTPAKETIQLFHQTIKKVTNDIENLRFNTAISQMMIMQNHLSSLDNISEFIYDSYLKILSPFLPHFCEEINMIWGRQDSIAYQVWPEYDENLAKEEEVEIAIQVNGKLRATIKMIKDQEEESVLELAKDIDKVSKYLNNGKLIKTIFIHNRLVNFVVH